MAATMNFNGLVELAEKQAKTRDKILESMKAIITHVYDLGVEHGKCKADYELSSTSVVDLAMMAVVGAIDGVRGGD